MKILSVLGTMCLVMIVAFQVSAKSTEDFDNKFVDKTMRIDYNHSGAAKTESITLDYIYEQGIWAGSRTNLIDDLNVGRYYAKVYDAVTGKLIFSKGFDSFFGEYRTTDPALKGTARTFHESVLIPYPKGKIKFAIEHRDAFNKLHEIFNTTIDPEDIAIIREIPHDASVKVYNVRTSGDPHENIDLVILGEGYTKKEEGKFKKDLGRFAKVFLSQEPYASHKDKINISGVFKPSEDSGVDEPRSGIYKKSALNATFNTFGSERYLMTEDNKSLRNLASHAPYDAISLMVNHKRYGGGAIYNQYNAFTTDNQWYEYLFLHEFGHSFTGLADEYYNSQAAYNDFYKKGVEPLEPNITELLDRRNVKWKKFIEPSTALPTPWEKAGYDEIDVAWQKARRALMEKIENLKKAKAPEAEIGATEEEYNVKDLENSKKIQEYLSKSKFVGVVGAFEGAGYSPKGIYRPMLDCIMFTKGKKPYCRICTEAILRMMKRYME